MGDICHPYPQRLAVADLEESKTQIARSVGKLGIRGDDGLRIGCLDLLDDQRCPAAAHMDDININGVLPQVGNKVLAWHPVAVRLLLSPHGDNPPGCRSRGSIRS